MSTLRLVHEDQNELRFSHAPLVGLAFVVVGAALAYFGLFRFEEEGVGRWLVGAMGVVFTVAGLLIGLWRHDLTLSLLSRTYRGRRGFWPSPRLLQGSLDELRGVVIERVWRRSSRSRSSGEQASWRVCLDFGDWRVRVVEGRDESNAFARLEHFARLLRVPAIDRTGDTETQRTWDELDRSVAEELRSRGEEVAAPGPPPTDSAIVWEPAWGMASIILPKAGFSRGTVLLFLLGLIFAGFGALPLLALSDVWDVPVSGSRATGWVVGGLFCLVGVGVMFLAVWGSYAREVVREERDGLLFYTRLFGQCHQRRFVPRRQVEEIELRSVTTRHGGRQGRDGRHEVVVRSDTLLVRIGSDLTAGEQRWLHQALLHLVAR